MAISTIYLDGGVLKSASATYNNQNPKNIRLENFFQQAIFSLLKKKLHNSKYSLKFDPYKYLYFTSKLKEIDSFLKGRYFDLIIKKILGLESYKLDYEIRKFGPGCYTLLHDAEKEKPGTDFIIDFSKNYDCFGGFTTYLTESEELLGIIPKPNSLAFVERKSGAMKFTKYVQHRQKSPLIFVVGTISKK